MPFQIIRNDITKVQADAIVNTANPLPAFGSGTDSAVYRAAGAEKLLKEREKIGIIHAGEAAVTPAFDLPAKYIIHTVGPEWRDGRHGETMTLASCYMKSMLLARQLQCRSIAFPLISAGINGFPKDQALNVALRTISAFLRDDDSEMDVTLVVFNRDVFELSSGLVHSVQQFVDDNYVERQASAGYAGNASRPLSGAPRPAREEREKRERKLFSAFKARKKETAERPETSYSAEKPRPSYPAEKPDISYSKGKPKPSHPAGEPDISYAKGKPKPSAFAENLDDLAELYEKPESSAFRPAAQTVLFEQECSDITEDLPEIIDRVAESFQERLMRMIDERGYTDPEVYKRANLDRKLFSKIRSNPQYTPKKATAVALAIALRLNIDETIDLLGRAGLALSPSSKADLIVEYCIKNGIYDIFEINAILFDYDQPLLGYK